MGIQSSWRLGPQSPEYLNHTAVVWISHRVVSVLVA